MHGDSDGGWVQALRSTGSLVADDMRLAACMRQRSALSIPVSAAVEACSGQDVEVCIAQRLLQARRSALISSEVVPAISGSSGV